MCTLPVAVFVLARTLQRLPLQIFLWSAALKSTVDWYERINWDGRDRFIFHTSFHGRTIPGTDVQCQDATLRRQDNKSCSMQTKGKTRKVWEHAIPHSGTSLPHTELQTLLWTRCSLVDFEPTTERMRRTRKVVLWETKKPWLSRFDRRSVHRRNHGCVTHGHVRWWARLSQSLCRLKVLCFANQLASVSRFLPQQVLSLPWLFCWSRKPFSSCRINDHNFKMEELETVGELSKVCSQIVLKCLCVARIGRPDILWSFNKLTRTVTKWSKACDRRWALLKAYIHHINDHRQYFHVGNTSQHCRLGLFQDSDFAGDFGDSKSTSVWILCFVGSRTFVPVSWMCKKQTSVSHSSTESEVISLDAGLRMDGTLALDLWHVVIEVLHSSKNTHQAVRDHYRKEKVDDQEPRSRARIEIQSTLNQNETVTEKLMTCPMYALHFWRQRSSHQNDHQRRKFYEEARSQNPQSCVGLVVW